MATTTEILALKQPSERLKQAINNCSLGFKKLADAIHEALELGKQEGFSPKEIGKMIREEMVRNGFTDRTVRKYLPAEAKMLSKVRHQVRDFAENNSTNSASAARNSAKLGFLPEDYQTEDLPKYTKQFLIEVIRYFEQKYVVKTTKNKNKVVVHETKRAAAAAEQSISYSEGYKFRNDKIQEILSLHEQGKSSREIARLTSVSKNSILKTIKNAA
jgi:hypothetical protein